VTRLLRAGIGVTHLDGAAARARVRERVPDADPQDLLLLDDLLGCADPDVPLPAIDPDARRRRLTAMINAASLARTTPALYILEDAQWIDEVSESMLAEFLTVVPQTPSMALITYRPEYEGALARVHGSQVIALAPLSDSETVALLSELLGPDPSVGDLGVNIVSRASLAIGMTGLATALFWSGRARDASRLATEQMSLLESIGDPTLTIGAAYVAIVIKGATGEIADVLRWSHTVIDLAEVDPTKGANFAMGSPLAAALGFRGFARYWLGLPGWREDLDDALAMARSSDPVTHALLVASMNALAIENGVLRADGFPIREIEETLQIAERSSGDTALGGVKLFLGAMLTYRPALADRQRGLDLLTQVRDMWLRKRTRLYLVPSADLAIAR